MSSSNARLTVLEVYISSINTLDVDAYLDNFTTDCIIHDPYGRLEFRGHTGLRDQFEALVKTWHFFDMRIDSYYMGGNDRVAIRWSVSATATNRRPAEYSGVSVFTFRADKIALLEAYWNYDELQRQIKA